MGFADHKPIRVSGHAEGQLAYRGAVRQEVNSEEGTVRITYDHEVDALYMRSRSTDKWEEDWWVTFRSE